MTAKGVAESAPFHLSVRMFSFFDKTTHRLHRQPLLELQRAKLTQAQALIKDCCSWSISTGNQKKYHYKQVSLQLIKMENANIKKSPKFGLLGPIKKKITKRRRR